MSTSGMHAYYWVLKEVIFSFVLLEEEYVVVVPWPGRVDCHDTLMILQLSLEANVSKLFHDDPVWTLIKMVLVDKKMAYHTSCHSFLYHHCLVRAVWIEKFNGHAPLVSYLHLFNANTHLLLL